MRTMHHCSISIEGILNRYKHRPIRFFTDENGKQVSSTEARKYLKECQKKGWKVLPMCEESECPNFDHFGGGCPGHKHEDE